MRVPMMAGNWKMNQTIPEAIALARGICELASEYDNVERVICPSFVCLSAVRSVVADVSILLGAQNMHWADRGPYTGEISPTMLEGLVQYVILGHSERRQHFCETDETVNRKVQAALAHGLTPIVCVGESLEQNQAGETYAFVGRQVRAALEGLGPEQVGQLVFAYEPIWAIGTGRAATPEQAEEVCSNVVRGTLRELYGHELAEAVRILYGGSTNPDNIQAFMEQPDIDGALIGGASLKADSYAAMVRITSELYARQAQQE